MYFLRASGQRHQRLSLCMVHTANRWKPISIFFVLFLLFTDNLARGHSSTDFGQDQGCQFCQGNCFPPKAEEDKNQSTDASTALGIGKYTSGDKGEEGHRGSGVASFQVRTGSTCQGTPTCRTARSHDDTSVAAMEMCSLQEAQQGIGRVLLEVWRPLARSGRNVQHARSTVAPNVRLAGWMGRVAGIRHLLVATSTVQGQTNTTRRPKSFSRAQRRQREEQGQEQRQRQGQGAGQADTTASQWFSTCPGRSAWRPLSAAGGPSQERSERGRQCPVGRTQSSAGPRPADRPDGRAAADAQRPNLQYSRTRTQTGITSFTFTRETQSQSKDRAGKNTDRALTLRKFVGGLYRAATRSSEEAIPAANHNAGRICSGRDGMACHSAGSVSVLTKGDRECHGSFESGLRHGHGRSYAQRDTSPGGQHGRDQSRAAKSAHGASDRPGMSPTGCEKGRVQNSEKRTKRRWQCGAIAVIARSVAIAWCSGLQGQGSDLQRCCLRDQGCRRANQSHAAFWEAPIRSVEGMGGATNANGDFIPWLPINHDKSLVSLLFAQYLGATQVQVQYHPSFLRAKLDPRIWRHVPDGAGAASPVISVHKQCTGASGYMDRATLEPCTGIWPAVTLDAAPALSAGEASDATSAHEMSGDCTYDFTSVGLPAVLLAF